MSPLPLCVLLILTPQPSWLLLPAAPPQDLAFDPDLMTPGAPEANAPMSLRSADLPPDPAQPGDPEQPGDPPDPVQPGDPEQPPDPHHPPDPAQSVDALHSPQRLMPLPEPGAFDNPGFLARVQKLARSQRVSGIPATQLVPGPVRRTRKVGIPKMIRAEGSQSLGIPLSLASQSSTPGDFIAPPLNLVQRQLSGTIGKPENYDPQDQINEMLQAPLDLLEATDEAPVPPEENIEPPEEAAHSLPIRLYPMHQEPSGQPPERPKTARGKIKRKKNGRWKSELPKSEYPESERPESECESREINQASVEFTLIQESVAPAQLPESPKVVKPTVKQGALAPLQEHHKEVESYVVQEEAPPQFPKPSKETEPVPDLEESPKPPEILEPSHTQQEVPGSPLEHSEGFQQETPALPAKPPQKVKPSPAEHEALVPPTQQNATQLQEPLGIEVKPIADQQEYTPEPPESMEDRKQPTVMHEALAQSSDSKNEHSLLQNSTEPPTSTEEVEAPASLQEASSSPAGQTEVKHPVLLTSTVKPLELVITITSQPMNEVESSTTKLVTSSPPPGPAKKVELSPGQQGVLILPPDNLGQVEPSTYQEVLSGIPQPPKETEPSLTQQEVPVQSLLPSVQVEPYQTQQGVPLQLPPEAEPSPAQQWLTSQSFEPVGEIESVAQQEFPLQNPQSPQGIEPSLPQQENPIWPVEAPVEAPVAAPVETSSPPEQGIPSQPPEPPTEKEANPAQPEVQFQPLEPLTEVEPPPLQEYPLYTQYSVQPEVPNVLLKTPMVITPSLVQEKQLHQELFEHVEPPPVQQIAFAPFPELPTEVKPSAPIQHVPTRIPEPSLQETETLPVQQGTSQQLSKTPNKVVQPSEPPIVVESLTTQQPASVPTPSQDKLQLSVPSNITIQPQTLKVKLSQGSKTEVVESSQTQQEPQTPSTEPPEKAVTQSPVNNEVTVHSTSQDQTQNSNVTDVRPTDLPLTTAPQYTSKIEHSIALQKITFPPKENTLKSSYVEFTNMTALQTETSATPEETASPLKQVTVKIVSPEVTITEHPASTEEALASPVTQHSLNFIPEKEHMSPSGPPTQSAKNRSNADICELCVCQNATLSCTGLPKEKKLRRVPVPEPNTYNGTFTVLNFQGNDISYIDKKVWKAYRWTERLILRDNSLTELRKDSFEGLLSLQYLDLSCNKIQYIERGTFEALPFLQYVNLGCNLITEVTFGMFQAWHGMHFLNKLILSRNPLTTIEDPYLYKLPALSYLDLGATQVSLKTVENILPMTLQLQKLILPSRLTCCLCQSKSTIEVVCKTLKMHCDSECLQNNIYCSEEASLMAKEGTFMKALQARKKSNSTELIIEPEKLPSDRSGVTLLAIAGDRFESQLSQELQPIIPNNNVRILLSHVLRTLKMDCSQPRVQLACAQFIFRTGLLLKLLNEQQDVKMAKADWDTEQQETDFINEDTESRNVPKVQEPDEPTNEVLNEEFYKKLFVTVSVIAVVVILVLVFCLIKGDPIYYGHREGHDVKGK
ncbi:PREDICTED: leucine-rich repeat-containing protein 37A2-like [Elephantulus edwardii]|uniref:leucine-rich repeat-containing protein 37A2-like n=1 Tax=Elephantulus edwardii TaxID=28737 RepID=UPI0003F09510|nr:PREDICTED: leucine-rich repeat-containing protein 37A2-like [Elephantulus edwardii]